MADFLLRSEGVISDIRAHLRVGRAGPEIEAYFADYVQIILCADIQTCVADIIVSWVRKNSAGHDVATLVEELVASSSKMPRIERLEELASMCGGSIKERFQSSVGASATLTTYLLGRYKQLISDRNLVAHAIGRQYTFEQVCEILPVADEIVVHFANAFA